MSNTQEEKRSAPVVRTLKPPPEIWELVQPVEARQFSPRMSFRTRLRLSATNLILMAIVGGVAVGVGTALFRFRGAQQPAAKETSQPKVESTAKVKEAPMQPSPASPASPIESSAVQPTAAVVTDGVTDRPAPAPSHSSKRKPTALADVQRTDIASSETPVRPTPTAESQTPKSDQDSKAATDTQKTPTTDSATTKPKATATLGHVVIAPPKSAPTPKAKVIQWP